MINPKPTRTGRVPSSLPTPMPESPAAGGARKAEPDPANEGSSRADDEPILCHHCGRTATNGISCVGACVADSGY
jgi:hypothetical protein